MTIVKSPPPILPEGTYVGLLVECVRIPEDHRIRVIAQKVDVSPAGYRGTDWRIDVASDPFDTFPEYPG